MPTHEEVKAAKAHLQKLDDAQELILEDMFDDLRSEYKNSLLERKNISGLKDNKEF